MLSVPANNAIMHQVYGFEGLDYLLGIIRVFYVVYFCLISRLFVVGDDEMRYQTHL